MKKIKKLNLIFSYLIVCLMLSGCYDASELEQRGLVTSMGVDKAEENNGGDNFELSLEIPTSLQIEDDKSGVIKKCSSATINSGLNKMDSVSGQSLYLGHTKACVFGRKVLENPTLFKETIDGLERNRELSRKIIIMATDGRANDILKAETENKALTGIFINDFYKNNGDKLSTTCKQDLEGIIQSLLSNSCAIIPKIEDSDNGLNINSVGIIKNYKLVGFLDKRKTRGLLYLLDNKVNGELSIPFEKTNVTLNITDKKSKILIEPNKDEKSPFTINVDIKIKGTIDEYTLNENVLIDSTKYKILQEEFAKEIENEVKDSLDVLQMEYKTDVIGFSEYIRKNYPNIYNNIDIQSAFETANFNPNISVTISGSGSIK